MGGAKPGCAPGSVLFMFRLPVKSSPPARQRFPGPEGHRPCPPHLSCLSLGTDAWIASEARTDGGGRIEDGDLCGAGRQRADRSDQIRRRGPHRLLGDAVGGHPFGRRHRQSGPPPLRHGAVEAAGRRAPSLRSRGGTLFLGLRRGDPDLRRRLRGVDLRGRPEAPAPAPDLQPHHQLRRARPRDGVRRDGVDARLP